jgi:Uma2 family endonuclease
MQRLYYYSVQGVLEYWIFDRRGQKVEVYRREQGFLKLVATLYSQDKLTSPLSPGFSCIIGTLF